jgi:hypothetical protein
MERTTPHDGPDGAEEMADRIGGGLDDLRGRLSSLRGDAAAFIRARPGTSLILAVVAGYLVGRILR